MGQWEHHFSHSNSYKQNYHILWFDANLLNSRCSSSSSLTTLYVALSLEVTQGIVSHPQFCHVADAYIQTLLKHKPQCISCKTIHTHHLVLCENTLWCMQFMPWPSQLKSYVDHALFLDKLDLREGLAYFIDSRAFSEVLIGTISHNYCAHNKNMFRQLFFNLFSNLFHV